MFSSRLILNTPHYDQLTQLVELDRICLGGLWTKKGYQRELDNPNSSLLVLSIEEFGFIVGCGCFWTILEEAHIVLLMIHPDYQGQGLGQLLLYSLLKEAANRNLERATLEVKVSNQSALAVYQKIGFQLVGRRKSYYQKTGEDALILWRGDLDHPRFREDLSHWRLRISDRLNQYNWLISDLDLYLKRDDKSGKKIK
ncbi:MAG: ribosomal protein S18-alanine N-acetyltransferase [cyanobacterium endosymbiont of Rhopalodia musculus]|uniref:ribosomal protein S18-alanine N-acetyltransferase n=1 Tax=cyanobacterium endosymbiont of Epithemia clementina EcSB TaxID=3034674 RepID=UPI00247FD5F1|nr:ribosomal protein S18-alanine N-acetyltransferase [cyanobacterium endosymbiont of Epithemia clementina EcSB]WGT67553.1 ribosomal protein S18-alanine N-acetyltransferase [cyanobacterium endosymbiont of Epithemia clementina EcSB]